jgi:hypothetical protein
MISPLGNSKRLTKGSSRSNGEIRMTLMKKCKTCIERRSKQCQISKRRGH